MQRGGKNLKAIEIIAVENLPRIAKGDNIAKLIFDSTEKQNTPIQEKDVIVITHKIVSKAEGRMVRLDQVKPSERAQQLAQELDKDAALVEVILGESRKVIRGKGVVFWGTPARPIRQYLKELAALAKLVKKR